MSPITLRCAPDLLQKDLTSQVVIVTGANSGCGLETSRQLAKQGATVILACRNAERGAAAAKDVGGVFLQPMDLASLTSIRAFVEAFTAKYDRLDILVNNAGIITCPFSRTEDGYEMQFGANYLGGFLLMRLLTPTLLKTAESTGKPSRFVALSSLVAANCGPPFDAWFGDLAIINFDDMNWETRDYNKQVAYQECKLGNYLHCLAASKRYPADQLISASVHPGWVVKSGPGGWKILPEDGCQSTLHPVLEDPDKMVNGGYYSQHGPYADAASQEGGFPMKLPNHNGNPEVAEKLWEVSDRLLGL
jgi:NAD(P)-dependent dehydrogenase (short-subunit alcohol dehydrogenase family)